MAFLVLLTLAMAPGIFWLWFFARRNIYRPDPRRLLIITFFLGMLSTIPAAILQFVILGEADLPFNGQDLATVAVVMFFVVGPVEEVAKFLAVRVGVYRSQYFDEPMDGLVYSAAASLGFASAENIGYILAFGPEVMVARGPISTLAHVVFGAVWGYPLALRAQGSAGGLTVLAGLLLAAILHGAFNVSLAAGVPIVALGLTIGGLFWVLSRFRWAQRVSPFRYRRNYPTTPCGECGGRIRVISRYCRFCGATAPGRYEVLYCGYCDARNRPDASYCTRCGDQLLT